MRAVIQRVSQASVTVAGEIIGEIDQGVVILLGITGDDTSADGKWLADKIGKLRIFADDDGAMNRSLVDIGGRALIVSQFTLHARTKKGTRPSFNDAAPPDHAEPLYQQFCGEMRSLLAEDAVATGEFGAMMQVALVNDGPVTLILDTHNRE
ncbi:MAG: D-tyrosyl-tRNA(Tyr) deacylase [Opitutaceae bacterium]|nr:D-tyrosyl-tRNA(Tyr) deacylase [Opitutaceae bacterium]